MRRQIKYKGIKFDTIIIIFIILVLLLGWLTSCNTVHKIFNKQRKQIDSTTVSNTYIHTDSSKAENKFVSVDTSRHSYINIVFSHADTQHINTPVFIKVDSNGTYIINAGERKINSVTILKSETNKINTDSVGLIAVRNIKKKSDSTHVENNTTTILKEKKSSRFPIQIVAGIVALLGLVAAGIYINRKLKLNI